MVRHYRVIYVTADFLEAKGAIMALPSEFKPVIRRIGFRALSPKEMDIIVTPDPLASITAFHRTYSYWKVEGRKIYFREEA